MTKTTKKTKKEITEELKIDVENKIKESLKCEHIFVPECWVDDPQIFGWSGPEENEDGEMFLNNGGFIIIRCVECGHTGWCLADR